MPEQDTDQQPTQRLSLGDIRKLREEQAKSVEQPAGLSPGTRNDKTEQPTAPDNVAMPAQPQLAPGQIALNVTPEGLTIQIMPVPIGLGLGKDGMRDIVRQWLAHDVELANELLATYIATLQAQKAHLTLVKPDAATVRQITKRSKLLN